MLPIDPPGNGRAKVAMRQDGAPSDMSLQGRADWPRTSDGIGCLDVVEDRGVNPSEQTTRAAGAARGSLVLHHLSLIGGIDRVATLDIPA
jgi:hypothetical protein